MCISCFLLLVRCCFEFAASRIGRLRFVVGISSFISSLFNAPVALKTRSDCLIANRAVRDAIEKLVLSTPDSGGLDIKLVRRWKWRKQPPTDQAKLLLAKGRVVRK